MPVDVPELGKFDKRLQIRRPVKRDTAPGEARKVRYEPVASVWAAGGATEGNESAGEPRTSGRNYRFIIRTDGRFDLRSDWQLGYRGLDLEITGVQNDGTPGYLSIDAVWQEAKST